MNEQLDDGSELESRYLLFQIGSELYGTPLLGVREVLEPQEAKPVPNTVPYFAGVINIRGEIIGVIDLRLRLGYAAESRTQMALMIFQTEAGAMAGLVDKVEAVGQIPSSKIEKNPNIKTKAPLKHFIGIGQWNNRLVTLISLNGILVSEEIAAINSVIHE